MWPDQVLNLVPLALESDVLLTVLHAPTTFQLAWTKSRKSYCTTPGIGIGGGVGVSKTFNVKVFYVMDKALSGELSCPCDRSRCCGA